MHHLEFADSRRERLFRIFDERHAARGIRLMAGAALLSIALLGLEDALGGEAHVTALLLWRGAMLAPMLGLFLLTLRRGGAGRWSTRLAWAAALLGAAEAGLLAAAAPAYRELHSPGMLVIMALTVSGLRLRFPHAVAVTAAQSAAYLATMLRGGDGPSLRYQLVLLAITATVSLLVARGHDQGRRRHFLEVLTLQASHAKLVRLGERLRKLSLSDELTGLPNRRELESRLEAALAAARRSRSAVTVAMVDLDRFKAINDTRGHAAGDAVLRQVAGVLARSLRASDSVFRIGGDELCVVMPDTAIESAVEALQRSLLRLRAVSQRSGVPVAFSAGCAEWRHGEDRAAMLARADGALYRAKRAGGARVYGAAGRPAPQALPAAS